MLELLKKHVLWSGRILQNFNRETEPSMIIKMFQHAPRLGTESELSNYFNNLQHCGRHCRCQHHHHNHHQYQQHHNQHHPFFKTYSANQ